MIPGTSLLLWCHNAFGFHFTYPWIPLWTVVAVLQCSFPIFCKNKFSVRNGILLFKGNWDWVIRLLSNTLLIEMHLIFQAKSDRLAGELEFFQRHPQRSCMSFYIYNVQSTRPANYTQGHCFRETLSALRLAL